MPKAKFATVKQLIEEERYAEARKILKNVNHPTAKMLLKEIDEIAPEPKSKSLAFLLISALLLIAVMVVAVVFALPQLQTLSPRAPEEIALPTLFPTGVPNTPAIPNTPSVLSTSPPPTPFESPQADLALTSTPTLSPTITETAQPSPTMTMTPTSAATTPAPTPTTMPATDSFDRDALRLSVYTFCMRKADDLFCDRVASSDTLQSDPNVRNCLRLFGTSLDDFGNCIFPQYAQAYDAAWKQVYPSTVVPDLCKASPATFRVPNNGNTIQVCVQHSKDIISRNPYYIVDSCYDTYLAWNKISSLADDKLKQRMTDFALCIWQLAPAATPTP